MKNDVDGVGKSGVKAGRDHCIDISTIEKQVAVESSPSCVGGSSLEEFPNTGVQMEVTVVIISSESDNNQSSGHEGFIGQSNDSDLIPRISDQKLDCLKSVGTETVQQNAVASSIKKGSLSRSESYHEQCRVCQQQGEETLIDLGCHCRGGLAQAHRSCIDTWFRTRGSNKCEICQQVAINVPPPESQPSRNYWVWRVDPSFRGSGTAPEPQRSCYSPLWVAFSILIGGLLLDVLISISLRVSALPVNIIVGVLVVLGLGTALRLALECFHEMTWIRGGIQSAGGTNPNIGPVGYQPSV